MDTTQLAALKAAIIATPVANAFRIAGDAYGLLAWCNAAGAVSAWKPNVLAADIYAAHKITEYINRSAAERQAFDLMVTGNRIHDFTKLATRKGVSDIFSGTTQNTSRTSIFAAAQELATNAQTAIGGTEVSVGGDANMAETVTALKRTWAGLVTMTESNALVN
jgi:hypothetical protein